MVVAPSFFESTKCWPVAEPLLAERIVERRHIDGGGSCWRESGAALTLTRLGSCYEGSPCMKQWRAPSLRAVHRNPIPTISTLEGNLNIDLPG